jgi:spermidine/putrescine transport system ATP-binding protein
VAEFVGDNNRWRGSITETLEHGEVVLSTDEGYSFRTRAHSSCAGGKRADLFLRPEAMRIEPRESGDLNTFDVTVKSILFDGANSRLLTVTREDRELIVTLPQNRKFDHIRPGDEIRVGWHPESGICFRAED